MARTLGRLSGAGSSAVHAFPPLMAGRIDWAGADRRLGDAEQRWAAEKVALPLCQR